MRVWVWPPAPALRAVAWWMSVALVLVACDQPTPSAAPSGPVGSAAIAIATASGIPPTASGHLGDASGVLLTEVGFAPAAGAPAFVEIGNHGSAPVEVAGMKLVIKGTELQLAGLTQPLASGATRLVVFDGAGNAETTVLHAPAGFALSADDQVDLLDAAGGLLDRVAWGSGHPYGVSLGAGGFITEVEPGMTIGRSPNAVLPNRPLEWSVFAPVDASPGLPNPMPGVGVLLPLSGTVLDGAGASLAWYPVEGATEYRIQVSPDPAFATTILDSTTAEMQIETGPLSPGEYSWRAAALGAGGDVSAFSAASTFEVVAAGLGARSSGSNPRSAVNLADHQLTVGLLSQHKDTSMLLLERNVETGAHPWDADHGALSPGDPSDNKNCAIASVAMVNHFFGGDLSQDRIGYELFKGRAPGPELDLPYGKGINQDQVSAAMTFALGAGSEHLATGHSPDEIWAAVTASIDAGRPVVAAGLRHTVVFTGYSVTNGRRLFRVNDPWNYPGHVGETAFNIDVNNGRSAQIFDVWLPPAGAVGRRQEPSVRSDGDGDGIVDFDETERFKTNPSNRDGDGDKVPDKDDVRSGIFDPTFGYAHEPDPEGQGRDYDFDGIPTERDSDSDRGGCLDGEEDTSLDGHRNGAETWNFDTQDDRCAASVWVGTAWHEITDGPGNVTRFEVSVNWILDPEQSGPDIEAYYPEGLITITQTAPDCTIVYAPASNPISKAAQAGGSIGKNLLLVYPDGSDGFIAFGTAVTIFDSEQTRSCPKSTVPTVVYFGPAGGEWLSVTGIPVSSDGKSIRGTSGITGDKYGFDFTKR